MMPERMLFPYNVAEILGISEKDVHALVRSGRLECVQVTAKKRRFTEEQVQSFIENQTKRTVKPVDSKSRRVVPSPKPITAKGGGEGSTEAFSAKALRQEMRQW